MDKKKKSNSNINPNDKWAKHTNSSQKMKYTGLRHTFCTYEEKANLTHQKGNAHCNYTNTVFHL